MAVFNGKAENIENNLNKTSSITSETINDPQKYPNVMAVTDYVTDYVTDRVTEYHEYNRITDEQIDEVLSFPDTSLDVFYPSVSAMVKYVGDKTGDIETTLDSIIAIQNELIGGDSV